MRLKISRAFRCLLIFVTLMVVFFLYANFVLSTEDEDSGSAGTHRPLGSVTSAVHNSLPAPSATSSTSSPPRQPSTTTNGSTTTGGSIPPRKRVELRYPAGSPLPPDEQWPARNMSCFDAISAARTHHPQQYNSPADQLHYEPKNLRSLDREFRQMTGSTGQLPGKAWGRWRKAYCRTIPHSREPKNLTHYLWEQMTCLQRGLDAITMPWFTVGGGMISIIGHGNMNLYETDNDVVVPSWFDSQLLQQYWSSLPSDDSCSHMLIWHPDKNDPFRVCNGIRNGGVSYDDGARLTTDGKNIVVNMTDDMRPADCGWEGNGDECSQIYAPYSDVFQLDRHPWLNEVYFFNVEGKAEGRSQQLPVIKARGLAQVWSKGAELQPLLDQYLQLVDKPPPDGFALGAPAGENKNLSERKKFFEKSLFKSLERFSLGGTPVSLLRRPLAEFITNYKYGFNRWRTHYPAIDGSHNHIMKACNSVYRRHYAAHQARNLSILP